MAPTRAQARVELENLSYLLDIADLQSDSIAVAADCSLLI